MAVKLVAFLVLITTVVAKECMPCIYKYDRIACEACLLNKSNKGDIITEYVPIKYKETEKSFPKTGEKGKRILGLLNSNQPTNSTQKETLSANNTEVRPTKSSQEVSIKEDMNAASSQAHVSVSPPTYEVHENIIDVPDDRVPAGPIIPAYTRPPVLNTVRPLNSTTSATNSGTTDVNKVNIQEKKNFVSILHIKIESDEKQKEDKRFGVFNGIQDYFCGLQRGLLNGIHSFFHHKHKRSTDGQDNNMRNQHWTKQNSNNVDKTDFFVRNQHISLT